MTALAGEKPYHTVSWSPDVQGESLASSFLHQACKGLLAGERAVGVKRGGSPGRAQCLYFTSFLFFFFFPLSPLELYDNWCVEFLLDGSCKKDLPSVQFGV